MCDYSQEINSFWINNSISKISINKNTFLDNLKIYSKFYLRFSGEQVGSLILRIDKSDDVGLKLLKAAGEEMCCNYNEIYVEFKRKIIRKDHFIEFDLNGSSKALEGL